MQVVIELVDSNDEIPQFIGLDENGRYPGSIAENLAPGAEVITVTATDKDEFPAFKKVGLISLIVGIMCWFLISFPTPHHHQFNIHVLPRLIKGMDGCFPTA